MPKRLEKAPECEEGGKALTVAALLLVGLMLLFGLAALSGMAR